MLKLRFVIFILLISLGLNACNDTSNQSQEESQTQPILSTSPSNTMTTIPVDLQSSSDRIVYVQGSAIKSYSFNTQQIDLITENYGDKFYLMPDLALLLYAPSSATGIVYVDLHTLNHKSLIEFSSDQRIYWEVIDRSPDDKWLLIRVQGKIMLVSSDGEEVYTALEGFSSFAGWFVDNSFLLVGASRERSIFDVFDMEKKESIHLDFDPEQLRSDPSLVISEIEKLGIPGAIIVERPVIPFRVVFPIEILDRVDPIPCGTWLISQQPELNGSVTDTTVHVSDNVYELSDVYGLDNNAMVFLKATVPDCALKLPEVELVWTDGTTEITVAEDVFPGLTLGRDYDALHDNNTSRRIAVSPDGNFAVWIRGDMESGNASLNLTDLSDNRFPSMVLLEEKRGFKTLDDFVNQNMFYKVYWITENVEESGN